VQVWPNNAIDNIYSETVVQCLSTAAFGTIIVPATDSYLFVMSPNSLSFRSVNIPETGTTISDGPAKDTFITSPLCSPIDILKDVRAYERERQQVKKAAELVRAKQRKESRTVAGRNTWSPWGDKPKTNVTSSGYISWFRGNGLWDNEEEKVQLEVKRPVTPIKLMSKEDSLRGVVTLADMVVPGKRKDQEGDFEVIPLPRQVIVLDEFTIPDIDVDEPWEHVRGDHKEKADSLSYAEIVSATN